MSHSEAPVLLVERRGGHSTHSPRLELRKVPMPQSVCMHVWMGKSSGVATPGPTWACALVNFTCALVNHWLYYHKTYSRKT